MIIDYSKINSHLEFFDHRSLIFFAESSWFLLNVCVNK